MNRVMPMIADPNETVETYCRNWDGVTPYARATIVHTEGMTAAKAGAKAVVTVAGDLIGWIGGGCIRGAVMRAARQALETATPQLIRVRPKEQITATHDPDGVALHASGCPSKGCAEIFIEPVMPKPPLVIIGTNQIARFLAAFGASLHFEIVASDGRSQDPDWTRHPRLEGGFIVIATQGAGDIQALTSALRGDASYVAFIGSRAKAQALRERLVAEGISEGALARMRSPAGLDIGARTASEIAISILAELISVRRSREKSGAS